MHLVLIHGSEIIIAHIFTFSKIGFVISKRKGPLLGERKCTVLSISVLLHVIV